jgi:hypothetical protein
MNPWRLTIALLCATSIPLLAQTPFAAPTLTSNTTIVLVPALVTTESGEPVYTLKAQDFTATDDGIPQKLTLE